MIATHPSVQHNCKNAKKHVCIRPDTMRDHKRSANRRHRRYLNSVTKSFINDIEAFDDESFSAPTMSDYDID